MNVLTMVDVSQSNEISNIVPLDLFQHALMQNLGRDGKETVREFFKGPAFFMRKDMQGMVYCGESLICHV